MDKIFALHHPTAGIYENALLPETPRIGDTVIIPEWHDTVLVVTDVIMAVGRPRIEIITKKKDPQ